MKSKVSQDIDEFIYLISHDVRASVRALLELPQWIVEDLEAAGMRIDGQVAQSIDLMNRHTGRLDRMLVDLLTFSRVGRMQQSVEVDLEAAVAEILEEIKLPTGFEVVTVIEQKTMVIGDRDIMTLLSALVSNSVKHHDRKSGRIVVTTRLEDGMVNIAVSDDGPGIEEQYRERVFGAMTTLRPRDEVEGSGMGLAVCRKIAAHYSGSVTLGPSPYGRGLLVEVRLPELNDDAIP